MGGHNVRASEADIHLDEAWYDPSPLKLDAPYEAASESMARFAHGIFLEEAEGPEAALKSYQRVLELDPGYLHLAVRVGQEYLRRGAVAEAIGVLKDAAKAKPEEFLPPLLLSTIYMRHLQKPTLAEAQARKALALSPENFIPVELLWEILIFSGQTAKSEKVLAEALKSNSTDPFYWLDLADLLRRIQVSSSEPGASAASEKIESALARAAEFGVDQPEVLTRSGDLLVLLGEIDKASSFYARAHELDPDIPNLEEKLATSLLESGKADQAEPLLRAMLEKNPQNLAICDRLAVILRARGDYEEALSFYQRSLILAPHHPARHLEVAELLLGLGRIELAIHYLDQARLRFPQSGTFTYLLALAYLRADQPDAAVGYFEKALAESVPGPANYISGAFYFEYGIAAEQAGMFGRAADLFKKAIEIDPANAARASNYLGYMWVERNENLDEAEILIRRALQSEPNNGAYVDSLGWFYYKKGEYAEALVHLLRAAELLVEPDPVVFDHIGDTYQKLGRNPEAMLYWKKSLQMDPENSALVEKIDTTSERMAKGIPSSPPIP